MKTKHTLGPWEISPDAIDYTQITVYAERGGERVATCFSTEADARLIAAAPELLDAAKAGLKFLDLAADSWASRAALRAMLITAINKTKV